MMPLIKKRLTGIMVRVMAISVPSVPGGIIMPTMVTVASRVITMSMVSANVPVIRE